MKRLAVLAVTAILTAGCGGGGGGGEERGITVFAAASLTDVFTDIGAAFEAAYPGASVTFNFAGSSALAEQVNQGAPVDVLATADAGNMQTVVDDRGVDGEPEIFAENQLVIAVPAENPGGVVSLADLARPEQLIGLCAEEVPCGRFAREALGKAGVTPSIDTNEPDVRALLTRIEAGELDAGVVYVTDVISAGDTVDGIDIPPEHNVVASYPIAVVADAQASGAAARFVDFVLGDVGAGILREAGFLA